VLKPAPQYHPARLKNGAIAASPASVLPSDRADRVCTPSRMPPTPISTAVPQEWLLMLWLPAINRAQNIPAVPRTA